MLYIWIPPSLSLSLPPSLCREYYRLTEAEEGVAGVAKGSSIFPCLAAGGGEREVGGASLLQQVAPTGDGQRHLRGGGGSGNKQGLPQYTETLWKMNNMNPQ